MQTVFPSCKHPAAATRIVASGIIGGTVGPLVDVGSRVGYAEGLDVGSWVGSFEGEAVGDDVGAFETAHVTSAHNPPAQWFEVPMSGDTHER